MAVTNNIREIREQRGIYQDDLAAAIGYSNLWKVISFFLWDMVVILSSMGLVLNMVK